MEKDKVLSDIDVRNPKLNYGADQWRRPEIESGDTVIYDEPGRVLPSFLKDTLVTYQAYYILVVKQEFGGYALYIKHGGGQEKIKLSHYEPAIKSLADLSSDNRYLVLYMLYRAQTEAASEAVKKTAEKYCMAFIEGRLKKRKMPRSSAVKVWIE